MDNINIVLATDNNYAKYCAATIASILSNTSGNKIVFYILNENLSQKNRKKITELKSLKDCSINFCKISPESIQNLPLNREWISRATYYRLLILDILPENIDKLIYLDCDVLVKRDIQELWDFDISKYLVGAVEDEESFENHKRLNLSEQHIYFNAGVLLINLAKLREFDFKNKCINYYNANKDKIIMQDQDILNGVFDGKCLNLPLCWNIGTSFYHKEIIPNKHYWSVNAEEAIKTPGIIHFTGKSKAWNYQTIHPYAEDFWVYLSLTSYKFEYLKHQICKFFKLIYSTKKIEGAYIQTEYYIKILGINIFSKKYGRYRKVYKYFEILKKVKLKNKYKEKLYFYACGLNLLKKRG